MPTRPASSKVSEGRPCKVKCSSAIIRQRIGRSGHPNLTVMMRNRSLFTGILLLALLLGACGRLLAAAFCPHMEQDHASCCPAQVSHGSASHEMMDGMQMGDMQMPSAAVHEMDANALGQPGESCAHCIGHSQTTAIPNTLREAARTNHGMERAAPLVSLQSVSFSPPFIPDITSRQHAPPGASAARHVLVNVFRI